jgi:F0F1-type ATP synthase gamma subunit
VFLLYNEFKGGLTLKQMLPVIPLEVTEQLVDYEFEPSSTGLLAELLPNHFATELYRARVGLLTSTKAKAADAIGDEDQHVTAPGILPLQL